MTIAQAIPPSAVAAGPSDQTLALLQLSARLMLEFNVRSSTLVSQIRRLARHLGVELLVSIDYRNVTLHLSDGRSLHAQAPEYRLNVLVSSEVLELIDRVCAGEVSPADAWKRMQRLEKAGPSHGRWTLALLYGLAASALACILRGDVGTIIISAVSSAAGLLVRKELGKRHWPLFSLPFVAAVLAGVLGGVAIRMGWTQTSGLCLVVPALMMVPGPHLINGLFDLLGNYIQTGVSRLVLSVVLLLSSALGLLLGGWVLMGLRDVTAATSDAIQLTLVLDVLLAGMAACGFGAFYNSPWRMLWVSVVCGMIGHGVRFVSLVEGLTLTPATFLACMVIGLLVSIPVTIRRLSFSSIAFAAAVPMMPGSLIFKSIGSALELAGVGTTADPALVTSTLALMLQATIVVAAMSLGLLAGGLTANTVVSLLNRHDRGAVHAR